MSTEVLSLPPVGIHDRQRRLHHRGRRWDQRGIKRSRVGVVGGGNICCPAVIALTQLGFDDIDIYDKDTISDANLSRGGVYLPEHVGQSKALVLAERARALSATSRARGIVADVRFDIGMGQFREYDFVLIGTHDIPSRLHVNRAIHRYGGRPRALIEGGLEGLSFSVQTIRPGIDPCYACPLSGDGGDAESYQGCNGVVSELSLGPAATTGADGMIVGALMAREAALMAAGLEPFFAGKELRFNAEAGTFTIYQNTVRPSCEDHQPDTSTPLSIDFTAETPVESVRTEVARLLGAPSGAVELYSPLAITASLRCTCGERLPVMRPQEVPLRPACPVCGETDPNLFVAEPLVALPDGLTLAACGIPDGQPIEAYVGSEAYCILPPLGNGPEAQ